MPSVLFFFLFIISLRKVKTRTPNSFSKLAESNILRFFLFTDEASCVDCHGYRINHNCNSFLYWYQFKEHTIRPLRKISSLIDPVVSENLHHLFISSQTKWSMRHPPPPLNHYFHFAFPHSPFDCPTNCHEILPISTSFFCRSYVCLHPNRFLLFLFTWKENLNVGVRLQQLPLRIRPGRGRGASCGIHTYPCVIDRKHCCGNDNSGY